MISLPTIAEILADERHYSHLPANEDLRGWNSDSPVFDSLVAETKPQTIIEVGSWKGRSALHLAKASAPFGATLYCVDTWLGGFDHLVSEQERDKLPRDNFNAPRLYHQFLRNFIGRPEAARIIPLQNTSLTGAKFFTLLGIKADLIYIDGSHDYADAYADICAFYPLLAKGGIMFGDDFRTFRGVFGAVMRFAAERDIKIREVENNFWIMEQPTL